MQRQINEHDIVDYLLFHSHEGIVKYECRLSFSIDVSTVSVVAIVVVVNLVEIS